jgi:hypothetical protein
VIAVEPGQAVHSTMPQVGPASSSNPNAPLLDCHAKLCTGRVINHITAKICRDGKTGRSDQPSRTLAVR